MKLAYYEKRFGMPSFNEFDLKQWVLIDDDGTQLSVEDFLKVLTTTLKEIEAWKDKSGRTE